MRLALLAGLFVLVASRADAQQASFVQALRELVERSATAAQDPAALAPIVERMAGAPGWDDAIRSLESRMHGELPRASDTRAFQLRVELGLAYRQRGRLAEALREFDAAAALQKEASDVHVLRALTLETAGQPDAAAAAFQKALSLDRDNPVKAYYVIARSAGTDRDRARQALNEAYRRSLTGTPARKGAPFLTLDAMADTWSRAPIAGDARTAEGFALLAAGKYSEAVAALRRGVGASGAVTSSPTGDSPLTRFTRARGYEAESRIPEARREYEAAVAGALTGRSLFFVGIGRLAQVEGDLRGAIAAFTGAVRLDPNNPLLHRELASALAADDRVDDAFAELAAALLIDPSDASVLAAIGQLFLDSGRYADAVAPLTRTLELAPDRFETHYALATALTHLGKASDAARALERFERARQQMVEKRRRDIDAIPPGGIQ
jgi:tetratricopeptide (TPR) repeat protein